MRTQGRGRTVDEWKLKPERADNHWLDCVAGCAVCGSMLGAALPEFNPVRAAFKGKIRLSQRRSGIASETGTVFSATKDKVKLSELRRKNHG